MKNFWLASFAITALLASCLACKSLASQPTDTMPVNTTASNVAESSPANQTGKKTIDNPNLEKADFTVTAEDLDREFTRDGVTSKDLEKYLSKNIAVSGRVATIVLEKQGTVQPWVTLYAPGILHGVNCYFDDDRAEQLKLLQKDKMTKVQGFQGRFLVPKISPKLEHCAVIEAS